MKPFCLVGEGFFHRVIQAVLERELDKLAPAQYNIDEREFAEGGTDMPTENEIKKIELATLYELRLMISESDKDDYSKEELLQFLDQIALVKK